MKIETSNKKNKLEGVVAYPGIVSGKARIINRIDDIKLLKEGEILVAPMTSPYHVPAMTIAKAVLTDEGGILSHAAILCRELKIPCIVGLKNATELIKSGDEIYVDASSTNGYVFLK